MDLSTRPSSLTTLQDLPEMTRDAIARGLSEVHVPDLSNVDRPNLSMPDIDVAKTVTGVATAIGLVRPAARPRWPFVLAGAIVVAVVSWLALNRGMVRSRMAEAAHAASEWKMAAATDGTTDEAVAFTAAETAPIEPSLTNGTGSDYPEGLGDQDSAEPEAAVPATW